MQPAINISSVNIDERKNLGLRAGDTVRVWQKIVEKSEAEKGKGKGKNKEVKEKTRLQAFEGLILAVKHGTEAGATFTVRKTVDGVGVERIFPLYTPTIDSIEILRRAKVRRAKLYHIRDKAAKEIRKKMKHELHVALREVQEPVHVSKEAATEALAEEKAEAVAEAKA